MMQFKELVALITSGSSTAWRTADICDEVWREICRSDDADIRKACVMHKRVPSWVLEELIGDPAETVRFFVAMKRSLTNRQIERLAADVEPSVRTRIALNRSTPHTILLKLAQDPDDEVREAANARMAVG